MEFTFLGTSSGVPSLQRNVSGLVVKHAQKKSWCLVDCGEGSQHQLLKTPYSLVKLSAIFITHVHGDHTYGLPGILASASMAGRKAPLLIVGPPGVEAFVRAAMRYTDVYSSFELVFMLPEPSIRHPLLRDFELSVHELSHRVPSYAYVFTTITDGPVLNSAKLHSDKIIPGPHWGQLAKGEDVQLEDGRCLQAVDYLLAPKAGQKVIVGGDNDTPKLLANAAQNASVLIHEATYTQEVMDKVGPGPQHSSAQLVADFAEQAGIPNLVLTHFSARYHRPSSNGMSPLSDIEHEARLHFRGALFLAEDLACYRLGHDGVLHRRDSKA